MAISFEKAFGIHTQMLNVRGQRMELLASNLANADTPGFKAKDDDFKSVLANVQGPTSNVPINATQEGHFMVQPGSANASVRYTIPMQTSIDGNTVESQIEQAKYAQNAIQYRASMQFVSGRIKGLMTALKGD